jgi:hypothetical protein
VATSDAQILESIRAGIAAVTAQIAAGNWIVEYREGPLHVKKESPTALLDTLESMRAQYEARTEDRSASVATFRGAI